MTRRPHPSALLAVALAASVLVSACGGGDVGTPDTVAPTVAITSSAAGTTATGPVTFTFTFSEDVGTSFTAEDIVVNGGTAGAFTRVSGTEATLVVTPAAGGAGTVSVSVAASKFTDIANNPNTAAAALEQSTNTGSTAVGGSTGTCTAAPCIGFSSETNKLTPFGALGAEIVVDPLDATNKVGKLTKVVASETWAGASFDPAGDNSNVVPAVDLATSKVVTLRVYSPAVGEVVMLKLEIAGANGAGAIEKKVTTTVANAWETLTFDFASPSAGSYDATKTYNVISVFPHFDTKVTADTVFYVDELKYAAAAGGSGSGTGTALVTFDEATAPGLINFGTNGAGAALVADPAGGSNKVLKVFKYTGSEQWAGTTVATVNVNPDGAANAGFNAVQRIPFSDSAKTMTVRVYSPAVGVRVRVKAENANDGAISVETDALTTVANAWETLTFDFNNPGKSPPVTGGATAALNVAQTYNKVSIFADFGLGNGGTGPLPADRVYYFDDIRFGGAAAGGGGGGGGASGCIAPLCVGFSGAGIGFNPFENQAGGTVAVVDDPAAAGNKVAKFVKKPGDGDYFGTTVTGLGGSVVLTADKKTVTMKVWSPAAGTNFLVKLEGGPGGAATEKDMVTTKAGEWETLSFEMPAAGTYTTLVIFPNGRSAVAAEKTMYVDDITFPDFAAASGGGGGGGSSGLTGGIFAAEYSGNLAVAGSAKSNLGGEIGFYFAPELFNTKAYDFGGIGTLAENPGGVPNFYFGFGLKPPAITNAYFGAYVNAPGNGTVDVSGFTNLRANFWGPQEAFEKSFTPQVTVLLTGPAVAGCSASPSGRSYVQTTVPALKIGAASSYAIPLSSFTLQVACSGETTVAQVLKNVAQVHYQLNATSIQYTVPDVSTPAAYPNGLNVGPVKFD